MNISAVAVAAIIPLLVGFIWYHPKVFANAWMKSIGATSEDLKKGPNMVLVFLLTYILSFFIAFLLQNMVIHQAGLRSIIGTPEAFDPAAKIEIIFNGQNLDYLKNFRTFKHGVFHGILSGLLFVTPILAINALFERKGFKYIAINGGYWILSMALMGGIICAWM